jgi:hypothetical protein
MSLAPETNPANPNPARTESPEACGRFAKGNPGGRGNPVSRHIAVLRQALLNCVTEEDIIAITKAVIEEAKAGNMPAAKLIFQYVLGKPGSAPELDGAESRGMQAPIANSSNGKADEPKSPAAPKASGSNSGIPLSTSIGAPSGLGAKADQWLDREVRRAMETLGKEPLANVV